LTINQQQYIITVSNVKLPWVLHRNGGKNNKISRCFVLSDDESVMDLYEIISRMNTPTLEETIRLTKWKFWFQAENEWIFYKNAGLY